MVYLDEPLGHLDQMQSTLSVPFIVGQHLVQDLQWQLGKKDLLYTIYMILDCRLLDSQWGFMEFILWLFINKWFI